MCMCNPNQSPIRVGTKTLAPPPPLFTPNYHLPSWMFIRPCIWPPFMRETVDSCCLSPCFWGWPKLPTSKIVVGCRHRDHHHHHHHHGFSRFLHFLAGFPSASPCFVAGMRSPQRLRRLLLHVLRFQLVQALLFLDGLHRAKSEPTVPMDRPRVWIWILGCKPMVVRIRMRICM